jgi:hypothetical protein
MGRITANLSLTSSDVMTSPISITVRSSAEADSGTIIRGRVADTTAGTTNQGVTVYKASDKQTLAYVYVRNMDSERENYMYLYAADATGDPTLVKIPGSEFAYFPVENTQTIKAYGTKTNQLIEYAVFGQDDPANTLS